MLDHRLIDEGPGAARGQGGRGLGRARVLLDVGDGDELASFQASTKEP